MSYKILFSEDHAKAWKEEWTIQELFWVLNEVEYAVLVRCEVSNLVYNCVACAIDKSWTASDVREWIPEFPL